MFDESDPGQAMRKHVADYTAHLDWPKVAGCYLELYYQIIERR